ncbi:MAG: exosortase/archaeosortase family protein [Pirellulaceae bacterium]|nr:exosortase/archaeosortase family protein [Pirellulaceae bacterium]
METRPTNKRGFVDELLSLLPKPAVQAGWVLLAAAFVFFYWPTLQKLVRVWSENEDYQHGFFVPIFAVVLLWLRRDMIAQFTGRGSWWALPVLLLWAAMFWGAVYFRFDSLPEMSMIPFFFGAALFVGGWQGLRWAWPAIVFLVFMIPLPGAAQELFSGELQKVATRLSIFTIQTMGIPSVATGNVITLTDIPEKPLEVAQACSGIRMLMLFFAICVAMAFLSKKPIWERLFIVASAVPIAVIANTIRIVLTAVLCMVAFRWPSLMTVDTAFNFMHDAAGYMMMPIGLLLLWLEMYLLSKLLIYPMMDRPLVVGRLATEQVGVASEERITRNKRRD